MNKIIVSACMLCFCVFNSCADKTPDHDPSLVNTGTTKSTATPPAVNTISPDNTSSTGTGQAIVAPLPQTVVNQVAGNNIAGINPAHGQPNHRCDIAVGAPLNSPVTKPATVTAPVPVTAKTVTAAGMNPPHGEPNHRCDIAVGAPLNSPATQAVPAKKDSGS